MKKARRRRRSRKNHDPLFKQLLRARLSDLVQIVAPDIAERLDFSQVQFQQQEFFTSPSGGDHRVDLLARVASGDGRYEYILIHVEIEARSKAAMAERLWLYYVLIWRRHRCPILPIVINLTGGARDVTEKEYRHDVYGREVMAFRYYALGLERSQAEAYLARPQPLAWALTPLMQPGRLRPAEHLHACHSRLAGARLSEEDRLLLINCVETYLELSDDDRREYDAMTVEERARKVLSDEPTWADQLIARGRAEGSQQGMQQGMQQLLLRQLSQRFGPLSAETRRRVASIADTETLARLGEQVIEAESLADLGLDGP